MLRTPCHCAARRRDNRRVRLAIEPLEERRLLSASSVGLAPHENVSAAVWATVPADLTGDGFVDFQDITILLAHWNQQAGATSGNLHHAESTPVDFADLSVLLAGWTGPAPSAARPQHIVGGVEATPNDWPWMASLEDESFHFCGGALIAPDIVLTAAHCAVGSNPGDFDVVLGRHDLSTDLGERIAVEEIIVHPDYNAVTTDFDVALVRLVRPSAQTPIVFARPEQQALFAPGVSSTIIGWGVLSEGGDTPDKLRQVSVPIVSNETANAQPGYAGQVTENMLAAGLSGGGKDSCQGDSGGPLMVADGKGGYLHAGIVSWGLGCARPNAYGIYTRTAVFADWIDKFLPSDTGRVVFDASRYAAGDTLAITVRDLNLIGPDETTVRVKSSGGDFELVSLARVSPGFYRGSILTSDEPGAQNNGLLEIAEGDLITVTYDDADDGSGSPAIDSDTAEIVKDDHGNDSGRATPVSVNTTVPGDLELHGDVDWFAFTAVAEVTYIIDTTLGTLQDSILILYDQDGQSELQENDDGGPDRASRLFWTAPASGNYFVEVSGYGSIIGSYTLSVSDKLPPDDHGNSGASATPLDLNAPTAGDLGVPGDVDWFSFSATAGTEYTLRTTLDTLDDSVLALYDVDRTSLIVEDDDGGENLASRIFWTAPTTDRYYLVVNGFDSTTGSYEVEVSDVPLVDDHGNVAISATAAEVNAETLGEINYPGDPDWFSFVAVADTSYTFSTTLSTLDDSLLALYDVDGSSLIDEDDDGGGNLASRIIWTAPTAGTYYLAVNGFGSNAGRYGLKISDVVTPDDHGDRAQDATPLAINAPIAGEIGDAVDVDWFAFEAAAGTTYTIATSLDTLGDSFLTLYDPGGVIVISDDDDGGGGLASRIVWTASESGTYFVEVSGFFESTGSYELSVRDRTVPDDHGGDAQTATPLGASGTIAGDIGIPGDEDWFSFQAIAGARYVIRTELVTLSDSVLALIGRSGEAELVFNDDDPDGGLESRIDWSATRSGTFFLNVGGFSDATGTYRLHLSVRQLDAEVVGRHVFYNGSSFDGDDPDAGRSDDTSIATDKTALLRGQTASFANYTSFAGGINGVMIDVAGWNGTDNVDPALFEFRSGNTPDPSIWPLAASPSSITLRRGAGAAGSDRITFIWPDGALINTWLQVTVRAGPETGLLFDDLFYFGNAVGDTGQGNLAGVVLVDGIDRAGLRSNLRNADQPAAIVNVYDFNRDRRVDSTDQAIVRDNTRHFLSGLKLITAPAAGAAQVAGAARAAERPTTPPGKNGRTDFFERLGRSEPSDPSTRRAQRRIDRRASSEVPDVPLSRLQAAAVDRAMIERSVARSILLR